MTNKELAEKIRDLYNKNPSFPTLEEVENILALKDSITSSSSSTTTIQTGKEMLLKNVHDVVKKFGVINILDAIASLESEVKLMDATCVTTIKSAANYLDNKAALQGSPTCPRIIP